MLKVCIKISGVYDKKYDEFNETCRKAWNEKFNNLCTDMARKQKEVNNCFSNETKNRFIECIPKNEAF